MHSKISNSWQTLSRLNHARLCRCYFRHPYRWNYHIACAFLYDWSSVWRSNAYQFTQKTASLNSNQFQEIRGYKIQYFRDKHPRGFQLIGQWKSCARFAYPEALRAAMICVLHSTNDYFPGERQLTWVAAGAVDLSRLRNWTCRGFCGVILL